jgi:hypothetical protein
MPTSKLNFGCGTNRLNGWRNMDAEVDITKPLPFTTASAQFILAEHVVEHVPYYTAIKFFEECFRVLAPGGVIRIAVPSIEQIMDCGDAEYFRFTEKWQKVGPTARGAMSAILYAHGHATAWTASLLRATLYFVGFEDLEHCKPGESRRTELRQVEGHQKVIGDRFNAIETLIFEGVKPLDTVHPHRGNGRVAIVVGGSNNVLAEVAEAEALVRNSGMEPVFIVTNDTIPIIEGEIIAATLHPHKLPQWLTTREQAGKPKPMEVWAHIHHQNVTNQVNDWAGSSGLFSVAVARQKGFDKIILAGVPMKKEAGHIVRKRDWTQVIAFTAAWSRHVKEIAPYVRSMSGWTAELLGKPDAAFLS